MHAHADGDDLRVQLPRHLEGLELVTRLYVNCWTQLLTYPVKAADSGMPHREATSCL